MEAIIYTTTFCPYCSLAKDWMKKQNIKFKEINVEKDQTALERMVTKTGQRGVPVIEINNQFIIGFNKTELSKAFGLQSN